MKDGLPLPHEHGSKPPYPMDRLIPGVGYFLDSPLERCVDVFRKQRRASLFQRAAELQPALWHCSVRKHCNIEHERSVKHFPERRVLLERRSHSRHWLAHLLQELTDPPWLQWLYLCRARHLQFRSKGTIVLRPAAHDERETCFLPPELVDPRDACLAVFEHHFVQPIKKGQNLLLFQPYTPRFFRDVRDLPIQIVRQPLH